MQSDTSSQNTIGSGNPVMTTAQRRFYASDKCLMVRKTLQDMVDSPNYNTDSDYFSKEGPLGFVDRHLHYLSTHTSVNVVGYVSNLKLMAGARRRN